MSDDRLLSKLSRTMPARKVVTEFNWVRKNLMQFSEEYRSVRKKYGKNTMLSCDWCHHKFELEDWMSLAQPKRGGYGPKRNWVLCESCVDLMEANNE